MKPSRRNPRQHRQPAKIIVGAAVLAAVVSITACGHGSSPTTTTQPSHPVSYSSQGVLPFANLESPGGVAVDTAGNLYVADSRSNRVLKLAAGASAPTPLPFTDVQSPEGVAVDTGGNLYVADSGHKRVLKLPVQPN
jgi:serine/threonine-protein kinase